MAQSSADDDGKRWSQWTNYLAFIANGKQAREKAESKIKEVTDNIRQTKIESKSASDRLDLVSQKLTRTTADLTLAGVKVKIQQEMRTKLEREIEEKTNLLEQMRNEVQILTKSMLQANVDFAKIWNCTQLGRDYRASMTPRRMEEILSQKHDLEHSLHDYLVAEKAYEVALIEKIELENKIKPEEKELATRVDELMGQNQLAKNTLLNLTKNLEELQKRSAKNLEELQHQRSAKEAASYFLKRKMPDNNVGVTAGSCGSASTTVKKQCFHFKRKDTQSTQSTQLTIYSNVK